jgi:hypothetical protein
MSFREVADLSTDVTISLGGFNKKLKKDNPTSIEGYYLGSREVPDQKKKSGFSYIHVFETPKGAVGVWGKTDLDRKIMNVPLGTMTRAEFDRMVPTQNGEMYKYKVAIDDTNVKEGVTAAPAGKTGGSDYTDSDDTHTGNEYTEETDDGQDDEDTAQAAALLAAEKKAKVQALLNKNRKG